MKNPHEYFFKNLKFKSFLRFSNNKNNKITTGGNNNNNRRFNNEVERILHKGFSAYSDPNVDIQANQLHSMTKKIWGGNFSSSIENKLIKGARVLDICCGPGYWSLDMAKSYPRSTFIGIDTTQFPEKEKLSNVAFLECNVHNGLPWPDDTFDFIHQRYAWASYSEEQWKYIISEIVRVCKPGGMIELMEFDWEFQNAGPAVIEYQGTLSSYFFKSGMNPKISSKIPLFLRQTGELTEVRIESRDIQLGTMDGFEGMRYLNNHISSVHEFWNYVSSNIVINEEEYRSKVVEFLKEFEVYKTYSVNRRYMAMKAL